ncbi:MAG: histidine--tRNA ligase [Planctomycetes bacterium]|nr:histidine--tRNA ligase [Planctomycetota bacterium]
MSTNNAPPAGTRDFLPEDVRRREHVMTRIKAAYERHGFAPLETPSMERVETLSGKYGDEGEQLVFRIQKRGEKLTEELQRSPVDPKQLADLALRYDLTVPLARVVAQYQGKLPKFFKRYQMQPVWRADRPQKGRFREFWQCDVDYVGTTSLVAEMEVMQAVGDALASLSFDRFHLRVNDRRLLTGIMEAAGIRKEMHDLAIIGVDKLDKIGPEGVRKELVERGITGSQIEVLAPILFACEGGVAGNAARLDAVAEAVEGRSATGTAGLATLRELLGLLDSVGGLAGRLLFDPSLARGLSYYTGPIFELAVEGLAGSMGGGGRYDELVGMFLGRPIPAVGFSLGLERILVVMEERGMLPALDVASDVMVLQMDRKLLAHAAELADRLRRAGFRTEVFPEATAKLGAQFQYADTRRIPVVAFIGDRELESGMVAIKSLASGQQELVPLAGATAHVARLLGRTPA